jgi:tyrosinase
MSVNLGPMSPVMPNVPNNPQSNGLGYNPRCLRRDVNVHAAAATTTNWTVSLINSNNNIADFQNDMQGFANKGIGVHTGGHYTIGGDPGGDFYASPGDPAFYLHHGGIDRTWWLWQGQDLKNRLNAIAGTITMGNNPASRNGQLSDVQDFAWLGGAPTLGSLLTTMGGNGGEFCYLYV